MNDIDINLLVVLIATVFIVTGFILNTWAFIVLRRVAGNRTGPLPEALRDRIEVTFWSLVSSILICGVASASLYRNFTDLQLWPPLVTLLLLAIGLSVKAIPPARWLYRYYNRKFNEG